MADLPTQEPDDLLSPAHIRELAELMIDHDLGELDLKRNDQRLRIRRAHSDAATAPAVSASRQSARPIGETASIERTESTAADSSPSEGNNVAIIKSPMVGTFYTKPNPDAAPFVKVGDPVGPETIVCIIEAMKVFNEIPAEVSGKIVSVLVENEESVDHGKPLFKVDTSG